MPDTQAVASRPPAVSVERALVGLTGLLLSSVVAAADGGYFSDTWSWVALVSLFLVTLRLILTPVLPLRRLDWAFSLGMGAFAAWVALSSLWAPAVTPSIDEAIRDFSYAAAVLLLLTFVTHRTVGALVLGAFTGVTIISTYGLLTRLHPDWVGNWDPAQVYRLSGTIGYWNGLGVYAAMGTLLALEFVAHSESRVVQAGAGAAPVLLIPTMLFTFSRGAWLALGVGLVTSTLLDSRRLHLVATALVLAPWPALAIMLAWHSHHLTENTISLQQASDEGGSLLGWIVVLALISSVAAVLFPIASNRIHLSASTMRFLGWLALAGVIVTATVLLALGGAPWTLGHRAVDSFTAPHQQTSTDQTSRLFDLSSRAASNSGASRSTNFVRTQ